MSHRVRFRHQDSALTIATVENVWFTVWHAAPQMSHLQTMGRFGDQHRDELRGEKQILVNVIRDGVPNFTDQIRQESTRLGHRSSPWRLAAAHIILLTGLRGITVRAFMSTNILLGKSAAPIKIFDRPDDAARWLLPFLNQGHAWTTAEFLTCYTAVLSEPVQQ